MLIFFKVEPGEYIRGLWETAGRTYMCGITKIILAQFLLNCQFLKSRFMLPAKYLNISFVWTKETDSLDLG